jgi:hypothetical protein
MGEPNKSNVLLLESEYIGLKSEPGEVKHLSTPRNRNQLRFRE